jgi:hypothetical protein
MRPAARRAVHTRRWPLWVVALIGMGLPVARAGAECLRREPGWLWNYEGTLGTAGRARMTLVIDGERVNGVYALAGSATDVILTGRLTAGRTLVLEGRDSTRRRTVRLTGTFPTRDPAQRRLPKQVIRNESGAPCPHLSNVSTKFFATDACPEKVIQSQLQQLRRNCSFCTKPQKRARSSPPSRNQGKIRLNGAATLGPAALRRCFVARRRWARRAGQRQNLLRNRGAPGAPPS